MMDIQILPFAVRSIDSIIMVVYTPKYIKDVLLKINNMKWRFA